MSKGSRGRMSLRAVREIPTMFDTDPPDVRRCQPYFRVSKTSNRNVDRRVGSVAVPVRCFILSALVAVGGCTAQIADKPAGKAPGSSNAAGSGQGGVIDGKWAPPDCNKDEPAFAPARLWQITDQQYVNIVRDVLGITLIGTQAEISTAANSTGAFTNLSESRPLFNDMLAQNYQTAAERVATQAALMLPTLFGSATPTAAQVQSFISSKVARLWRRPPSASEMTALANIYQGGAAEADGGAANAVGLLLEAVLQSPSFLFRTELGATSTPASAPFRLDAFEIAAAVSFVLTDSAPDDTLWQKAQDGTLLSADVLATEVDRLMALPSAAETMVRHLSTWVWVERFRSREKTTSLYPEYTPAVQASVYQSGLAFLRDIVSTGKLADLFSSTKIYVNQDISNVFGIPGGTSATLTPVSTSLPERSAGILTQPVLLAATNQRPDRVDPIHHGLFVLEELLCGGDIGQIPGPPPDAFAKAAMMHGDERQLADQRAKTSPCGGCHGNFDPYGLTRLNYDSIGRFSTTKYVALDSSVSPPIYSWATSATPLDASTTVPAAVGSDLAGPLADTLALAKQLNSDGPNRRVAYCAGTHLTLYSLGHDANLENSCALRNVKERFYQSGSFPTFYRELLTSSAFITRDPGK